MLNLTLYNLDDTAILAHYLANFLCEQKEIRNVLLKGEMGSGKTTLTRALVEKLEHADQAEISSPSFTICNHYPTNPPVLHCDLYRVEANLPNELTDEWDNINQNYPIIIVEWAEYIPKQDLPLEYLDITLKSCQSHKLAVIELYSPNASNYVFSHQSNFDKWIKR